MPFVCEVFCLSVSLTLSLSLSLARSGYVLHVVLCHSPHRSCDLCYSSWPILRTSGVARQNRPRSIPLGFLGFFWGQRHRCSVLSQVSASRSC